MGGLGSGRRCQSDTFKKTVDSCYVLNIFELQRKGIFLLKPESSGTISWSNDKSTLFVINIHMEFNRLILNYYNDDNQKIEYSIFLTTSPCYYGGTRSWFICPNNKCQRRVAVLYISDKYFLCRHCNQLTYRSRNESKTNRMYRKARKIRKKLNASMDLSEPMLPNKPRGMHWDTFNRLRYKAEKITDEAISITLQKICTSTDIK